MLYITQKSKMIKHHKISQRLELLEEQLNPETEGGKEERGDRLINSIVEIDNIVTRLSLQAEKVLKRDVLTNGGIKQYSVRSNALN